MASDATLKQPAVTVSAMDDTEAIPEQPALTTTGSESLTVRVLPWKLCLCCFCLMFSFVVLCLNTTLLCLCLYLPCVPVIQPTCFPWAHPLVYPLSCSCFPNCAHLTLVYFSPFILCCFSSCVCGFILCHRDSYWFAALYSSLVLSLCILTAVFAVDFLSFDYFGFCSSVILLVFTYIFFSWLSVLFSSLQLLWFNHLVFH